MPLRPMERRAVASGALGSALEYFDFAVYGALSATLFPRLFFSHLGSTGALLASFATFGVGFVARPVGALFFGHLGDRIGRRPVLFTTLLLMGAVSILIGLLPTGRGFGIAALLVGLRFLQGFSLGGETIGNQLMTMEHCDRRHRGQRGALIIMGSPISQVLANGLLVVLGTVLTQEQFSAWGWRIPFLGSIFIIAVAVYIRLKLEETPAFAVAHEDDEATVRRPAVGLRILLIHPKPVLLLLLAWAGTSVTFYLVAVFGLNYLPSQTGMSSRTALFLLMIANGVSVVFAILGGASSDRWGRKPVWYTGLAGCFVGVIAFFTLVGTSTVMAGIVVTVILSSIQFLSGAQPALFAEQFPTEMRFSGAAVAHTFANLFFSAPAPFVATALMAAGGSGLVAAYALVVLVVSAIAVSRLRDGRHLDLATYTDVSTLTEQPPSASASART